MNERADSLCYSFLITIYKSYKDGCIKNYEEIKRNILFDSSMKRHWIDLSEKYPDEELWDKSNESVANLLSEMLKTGIISVFEYEQLKNY